MKNLITILMITSTFVLAQIPQTVSFQGYLSDANGEQISDGNYEVTFRLFDALTDGNSVWEETHSMEISGSLISANLGSFTPIILPETGIPYLEIQIGDEILTPRQEITSSFFAFKSSESDTAGFAKTIPLYFTLQLDSLSTVTDSLFNLVLEEPDTAFIITYDTTFVFDSTFIFTYDTLTIFDTLNIVTYDTTTIFDSTFVFSFDTTIIYDTLNIFTYDTTVVYDTTYISVDSSAYADTSSFARNSPSFSFNETEIFSGSLPTTWTDLDLSSIVGSKTSLVLIKFNGHGYLALRPDGSTEEWVDGHSSSGKSISIIAATSSQPNAIGLVLTGSNGIVEMKSFNSGYSGTISVLFYLN